MALVAVGGCRVTLVVGSAPCASAAPGPRAGAVPVVAGSALVTLLWEHVAVGEQRGLLRLLAVRCRAGDGLPSPGWGPAARAQYQLCLTCGVSRTHPALSEERA